MSHLANKPVGEEEQSILDALESLAISTSTQAIQKTSATTFANVEVGSIVGVGSGGGYTNLTEFIDQTAWRVFYSNGIGDVTELALGANGTFLKSNGASVAPTFSTPTSGAVAIPQYNTDPVAPAAEDAWVLRTETGGIDDGVPIGLLLGLTYTGNTGSSSYQLSYRTQEATTIRVAMV